MKTFQQLTTHTRPRTDTETHTHARARMYVYWYKFIFIFLWLYRYLGPSNYPSIYLGAYVLFFSPEMQELDGYLQAKYSENVFSSQLLK